MSANPWANTIRIRFDPRDWPEEPCYVVIDPDGRLLFEHYDVRLARGIGYALSQQMFDPDGHPFRLHVRSPGAEPLFRSKCDQENSLR